MSSRPPTPACFVFAVAVIAVGCDRSPTPARPATPSPVDLLVASSGELIHESWAAHYVQGAKVGHRHEMVFRLDSPTGPRTQIVVVDHLEMRRFGDIAEQTLTTASLENSNRVVTQIAYRVENGDSVQTARGAVDRGTMELTRESAEPQRFNWSANQGGIFAVERSLRQNPMQPEERREIEAFLPLLDRVVRINLHADTTETVTINNETTQLLRVEATDPQAENWNLPTIHWVDETGQIWKTEEAFLDRETICVDEATALAPNDTIRVDLGTDVGVRLDKRIDNPWQREYAVYRIRTERIAPDRVFPTSLSQRLIPQDDGSALLAVRTVTPDSPSKNDAPIDPPTPDDLAPNALIQTDHPRVVAMANAVAGAVQDPWQVAKLLEGHLYRVLDKVDYSQVFSSAGEVAERKTGDCSEHAVLLAATCRARGIPARVVVGLLYSDQDQAFLYHMWNEVWILDRWVPLDATMGQGRVDACHLKLRDSSLANQTAYSMVSPVIYLIGKLQIDVETLR